MAEDAKTPLRERLRLAIGMTAGYYERHPDLRGFVARASVEPPPRSDIVSERLLKPLYEGARPLIQQGIDAGIVPIRDPTIVFVILNLLSDGRDPPPNERGSGAALVEWGRRIGRVNTISLRIGAAAEG